MLNYVVGGTVITLIGSNIANTLVHGTIALLCSSASFLHRGTESNKMIEKIRLRVEEMDIPIKLKLVQKLLDTLPHNDTNNILEEGLIEIMFKIKSLLEWVNYEIDKHNQKWFASYRSISMDSKLDDLEHLLKILDGRINLMMNSKNMEK
jgi:hypothetical protein